MKLTASVAEVSFEEEYCPTIISYLLMNTNMGPKYCSNTLFLSLTMCESFRIFFNITQLIVRQGDSEFRKSNRKSWSSATTFVRIQDRLSPIILSNVGKFQKNSLRTQVNVRHRKRTNEWTNGWTDGQRFIQLSVFWATKNFLFMYHSMGTDWESKVFWIVGSEKKRKIIRSRICYLY